MGAKHGQVVVADPSRPDGIRRAVASLRGRGGVVHLNAGPYVVDATVQLPSDVAIVGAGPDHTTVTLLPGSSCHVFTNADCDGGNQNIALRGFRLEGQADAQPKPDGIRAITYACGAEFTAVTGLRVDDVRVASVRQSGFHLVRCVDAELRRVEADEIGWSGVASICTDDLRLREVVITKAGQDGVHPAVHLDGGRGAYLEVVVDQCSGDGVLLDSKTAPLSDVVVHATARRAWRGLSVSGDHENELASVMASGDYSDNRECGVLVSNASHVFIIGATIGSNANAGMIVQGTSGTRHLIVADCHITGSPAIVQERDNNRASYLAANTAITGRAATTPSAVVPDDDSYEGHCNICGEQQVFVRRNASLREGYRCGRCKALLRYRGQAAVILREYARRGSSTIAELVKEPEFASLAYWEPGVLGPFRDYIDQLPNVTRSDFLPGVPLGETRDGVRCEDLMALTFPDRSFDLIVTSDIFEHVRHPMVAFAEVHRVLRPGGRHVFSIPVQAPLRATTVVRVDTSSDEDVFLLEPRYHSGPGGSRHLVYNDFGRDVVDQLGELGLETEIVPLESVNTEAARLLTFCSVKR